MTTELIQHTIEQRPSRRHATVEEFWALPESMLPTEYVNGEIIMSPSPAVVHQVIVGNIYALLRERARQTGAVVCFLSPLDVELPSGDVVQPDVFCMSRAEAERALTSRNMSGVPSLLIEILSPGSIRHDTITKRDLYERNGVREYWIVDPESVTVAQLVLEDGRYRVTELAAEATIRSSVLVDFEILVGKLFATG